jgi:hypothetical protein
MKKSNKFGYLMVAVAACFIAGALLLNSCSPSNQKVEEAGQYVLKVLKVKYKKEFVINSGHYIANTGGYEFKLHPKNDPDFTFNAWLNGMTESGESDEYFLSLRTEQGKRLIAPYIKAISNDYYISAVGTGPSPWMKNYKAAVANVHNNMLSICQQLQKYPNEIEIDAGIHINYNITPKNEDFVLKKVYKLIEFLKEKKFGYIQISLYFYDCPNKNIKELGEKDVNFSLDYRFQAPIWIYVTEKDIAKIKTYKDIKQYFIYMKNGKAVKKNES